MTVFSFGVVSAAILALTHVTLHLQVDLSSIGQDRFYSALDEAEGDEDEANGVDFQRLEKERLPFAGSCSSPDLKVSVSKVISILEKKNKVTLIV